MYEETGLSSLERLVGRDVVAVNFMQNYVTIDFTGELTFTCYTPPVVTVSEQAFGLGISGYRDRLVELIGKAVQSVVERPQDELSIAFDGGDTVSVSLRLESFKGPEAAMLHEDGGDTFDVWGAGD